jgi:hypothetical protein
LRLWPQSDISETYSIAGIPKKIKREREEIEIAHTTLKKKKVHWMIGQFELDREHNVQSIGGFSALTFYFSGCPSTVTHRAIPGHW